MTALPTADAGAVDLGGGRSLYAVQAGDGPDLVLIHGALTTSHDWLTGPADALAEEHRVTIVDRPGHGRSRRPRFVGTPRDQAEQIASGLERLGIDRATIVAHSFGGLVALAFAERFPERVEGLVLLAPIAFPEPRFIEHTLLAPRSMPLIGPILSSIGVTTQFDRTVLNIVHELMFAPQPAPERWKATYPYERILDSEALVMEGEDAAAILPMSPAGTIGLRSIRVPVHILQGTADQIVDRRRHAEPLSRLLPNARLTEIEGGGHMLHHSHSETVVEAIRTATAAA
ncbi:MAG TPA: alpha/beta hydrolase [Allosphingosinicella sp.]